MFLNVLHRDFPDVVHQVNKKIEESIPKHRLTDLAQMETIISSFKRLKNIDSGFKTNRDNHRSITKSRALAIAVTLMFYQPERLMGLTKNRNPYCSLLSRSMNTSAASISQSTSNAIVAFKAYALFRQEVYELYEQIKEENNFFK